MLIVLRLVESCGMLCIDVVCVLCSCVLFIIMYFLVYVQ